MDVSKRPDVLIPLLGGVARSAGVVMKNTVIFTAINKLITRDEAVTFLHEPTGRKVSARDYYKAVGDEVYAALNSDEALINDILSDILREDKNEWTRLGGCDDEIVVYKNKKKTEV